MKYWFMRVAKLYIQHITFFWAVSNLLGIVLYLQECTKIVYKKVYIGNNISK